MTEKVNGHSACAVPRVTILNRILDLLNYAIPWAGIARPSAVLRAATTLSQAEALVELLEIEDCGSVGGFDKNQPRARSLYDRWEWLVLKHNTFGDISLPTCAKSISDVRAAYRRKAKR